jgi:hypothetical protein
VGTNNRLSSPLDIKEQILIFFLFKNKNKVMGDENRSPYITALFR